MAARSQGNGSLIFFAVVFALFGAACGYRAGEGAVRTFQTRRLVREAPSNRVDPANDDHPVVVRAEFRKERFNAEFGVAVEAAFLVRLDSVFESYTTGGKNSTTKTRWRSPRTDVITRQGQGVAREGQLMFGAYLLGSKLLSDVPTTDDVPITEAALATARERPRCTLLEGRCYSGDPHAPKVGDHRISFRARAPGPASILAEQINGCCLRPWVPPIGGASVAHVGPVHEPLTSILDRVARMQIGLGASLGSLVLFVVALAAWRASDNFPGWLARRFAGMRALNHVLVSFGLTIAMQAIPWTRAFPKLGMPILAVGLLLMIGPLLIARVGNDTLAP